MSYYVFLLFWYSVLAQVNLAERVERPVGFYAGRAGGAAQLLANLGVVEALEAVQQQHLALGGGQQGQGFVQGGVLVVAGALGLGLAAVGGGFFPRFPGRR